MPFSKNDFVGGTDIYKVEEECEIGIVLCNVTVCLCERMGGGRNMGFKTLCLFRMMLIWTKYPFFLGERCEVKEKARVLLYIYLWI